MYYDDHLEHFNPNHDPRNGQFAKRTGGNPSLSSTGKKISRGLAAIGKPFTTKRMLETPQQRQQKYDKKTLEKGINSFKPIQNTDLKRKNGQIYFSKEQINACMAAIGEKHLNDIRLSDKAKNDVMKTISTIDGYQMKYDVLSGKYSVVPKTI